MSRDEHTHDHSLTALLERAGSTYEPPAEGFAKIQALMHAEAGPASQVEETLEVAAPSRGVSVLARRPRRERAVSVLARPWVGGVAAALVGVLVLGGSQVATLSGAGDAGSESTGVAAPMVSDELGAPELDSGEGFSGVEGGATRDSAGVPGPQLAAKPAAPPAPVPPDDPGRGPGDSALVVRDASMEIVVEEDSLSARISQTEALVVGLGGYVSSSSLSENAGQPAAQLTLRVPEARFPDALRTLRGLGEVQSEQQSARDVTGQAADLGARLKALQASRDRYLALLAEAKTVGEILTVQQRIDEVQSQIEVLSAQVKTLSSQAALGSVQVRLYEEGDVGVLAEPESSWERAWSEAVEGFTSGVRAIIASSGRVLLIVLCGLAGWGGFRLVRRSWRRRQLSGES